MSQDTWPRTSVNLHLSIRGFAAKAPAAIFETTMSVWQTQYNAVVEEDQVVTTQQDTL